MMERKYKITVHWGRIAAILVALSVAAVVDGFSGFCWCLIGTFVASAGIELRNDT